MEFGGRWLFDRSADGELDVVEAPGTLVRVGMSDRVELRLGVGRLGRDAHSNVSRQRHRADGFADPEVGVKWALMQPGRRHGSRAARPCDAACRRRDRRGARASIRLRGSPSRTRSATAPPSAWNLGYEVRSVEGDAMSDVRRLGRWVYSASMGFDITSRWGGFVELFGDLPASDPGPAVHAVDGGVTYLVAPRVQLDVSAGVGVERRRPDRFVGVGLSFRVPR